ncbi:LacI family transcriptional regulator [Affinibrenneria salicis]|uniref:LacI family transcriptional regulator n=1 Tax=Affinibrenneria salicis TaxID=2590031 RepID=A0A5J5G319_9GAMM|nr:LacI family DNA-binding transcriptional regulator [Affinibrenneria salicis]KAA9001258.1 LacI family transcriptional regulator [Affinibrenneria salicis]
MSVTVKDVAKKAGVATSTVSRVINNSSSISEATKKKVNQVMLELGYVPNVAARNLGKGKTNTIALVLPPLKCKEEMSIPFFLEIIESINSEAQNFGISIALAISTNFDDLLHNIKRMHKQKQVDGFILLYSNIGDPVVDYLYKNSLNFTLVGLPCKNEDNIAYVDNDNQLLGKQATEHLINNGHRNIIFITNRINENVHFERFFGYQKAMAMAKLPHQDAINIENPEDFSQIEAVFKNTNATAAVIIEDLLAFRAIQYFNSIGYAVPEKISVISFNNTIFSSLTRPYITNIDISIELLGKYSLHKLIEQMEGKKSHGLKIVVPHHLIEKETVIKLAAT